MKVVRFVFVVFGIVTLIACSCNLNWKQREIEAFNNALEKGNDYVSAGDFAKAEESYATASRIAERMEWADGVIISRRNLAKSLSFQGRSAEGAVVLRDALSICLADKTCSDDELSLTYEGLVFEYAVQLKDIKLAVLVINEMVAIRERFGDETEFHALLRRCVDTLRASGFSKEADDLSGMIANQRK